MVLSCSGQSNAIIAEIVDRIKSTNENVAQNP